MQESALKELYLDELKDLYDAENQLVKALPKMAKAATSEDLRAGFEEHLEQTKGHVKRLEQIFSALGEKPTGKKCKGMEGLIEEGSEMMDEDLEDEALDAGLISAAQRVEHYEIAAYATARALACELGYANTAPLYGEVVRVDPEGVPHTLAILQGYIDNQGDAWNWSLDYLRRSVDELAIAVDTEAQSAPDRDNEAILMEGYSALAGIIGRRLGDAAVRPVRVTNRPVTNEPMPMPLQVMSIFSVTNRPRPAYASI